MANGTTITGMVAWPYNYPRNPAFDYTVEDIGPDLGFGPLPFGLDFIVRVGSTLYDSAAFLADIDDLLAAWVGSPLLAFDDQAFGSSYRGFDYGPGSSGGLVGQDAIDKTVGIVPNFLATRWMTGNPAFVSQTIATLAAFNFADSSLAASEAFFVTDYQNFSNFASIYAIQGADPDYIPRTYSGFTQRTPNLDDVCGQWPAEGFPFFPPQVNRITYVLDPQ